MWGGILEEGTADANAWGWEHAKFVEGQTEDPS